MKKIFRVGGTVTNILPEKLVASLSDQFSQLKGRPRIFGYDIELVEDQFELYINTLDEIEYQIQINFIGIESDLKLLLEKVKISLLNLDLQFDLVYYEEDEDGNQLSEDKEYFTNL